MDFRCVNPKCQKILFRGSIDQATIEIKCPKCGHMLKITAAAKPKEKTLTKGK